MSSKIFFYIGIADILKRWTRWKKLKNFKSVKEKWFPVDFEVSRNDPRRKFETKTLLLGVMQNPNSESGLHVYNQRSRVGFASLELSSPNYLFSQFFWNFRKATFYGQWKWRRRRFLFSLVLFIHNGFYHALIPLYCFEDPFHLQICWDTL